MIIRTRIFELCDGNYSNLSELAKTMEISVSQIYRVREGKRNINQKFIIGAIKAFPKRNFEDLFYLAPEPPLFNTVETTVIRRHRRMVQQYTKPDPSSPQRQAAKEKQRMETT